MVLVSYGSPDQPVRSEWQEADPLSHQLTMPVVESVDVVESVPLCGVREVRTVALAKSRKVHAVELVLSQPVV